MALYSNSAFQGLGAAVDGAPTLGGWVASAHAPEEPNLSVPWDEEAATLPDLVVDGARPSN